MSRNYVVVDVFTTQPLLGNPVAVVLDAEGLNDADMQSIARWTNLSETTFLLPPTDPGASYRLRIFTPRSELPFAGHPTLGSAHAALEAGRVTPRDGVLVQECGQGLIRIAVEVEGENRRLALDLPAAMVTPLSAEDADELEAIIGAPVDREAVPAIIDVGAVWVVAQLEDAEALLALKPDFARSARFERRLGVTGLSLFGKHSAGDAAIEVRSFAPSCGVDEDPVCGSGNGSIAVFRNANGAFPNDGASYVATQGRQVGRDGRIAVTIDAEGRVAIGGNCVTVVQGTLRVIQGG